MQPSAENATAANTPRGPLAWGQVNFLHTTDTHGVSFWFWCLFFGGGFSGRLRCCYRVIGKGIVVAILFSRDYLMKRAMLTMDIVVAGGPY